MLKETKSYPSFSPMIVPVAENETEGEFLQRWKKFDALPKEVKSKLSASETLREMENVKRIFNLELSQVASISRLIRSYYFGEVKIENFASILSKEIGIDLAKAQEIAKHITEKIINRKARSESGAGDEAIVKLPIVEALKKYPKLGGQKISANNIKLKIFPDPVRPSIKNWIADYRQTMGIGSHEVMEKSNYLFHSENTRKLNSQELQKLSLILKSLDGSTPLTIDVENQRIIFPPFKANRKTFAEAYKKPKTKISGMKDLISSSQIDQRLSKNSAGSFRFSSPQTLESEKEGKEKIKIDEKEKIDKIDKINKASKVSKNPRYYQIYPIGADHNSKGKSEPKIKGNVVDLREDS